MFEVGASTSFRAFHAMPDRPPPENERHPHDYRVDVVAERERLDERGMVCDLDVVTGSLADVAAAV
ncbi:MAG TPA: 6-carboxytetrahydropterin synthase, partial [Actinomycetota bacterium]|nr:6-carboxytetrahydropterin synthase [Actinomycetota bacterium]